MAQAILSATLFHIPPGSGVSSAAPLNVTSNYVAMESGTLDIPNGTLAGVVFPLEFGTVDTDAQGFYFKNTNNQDMILRLNGSANLCRIAPGGIIMISHPAAASGGVPTPLLSAEVVTTATQVGLGTVNYYVFGA